MSKHVVFKIAKQYGVDKEIVINVLGQNGIKVKNSFSSLSDDEFAKIEPKLKQIAERNKAKQEAEKATEAETKEQHRLESTDKKVGSVGTYHNVGPKKKASAEKPAASKSDGNANSTKDSEEKKQGKQGGNTSAAHSEDKVVAKKTIKKQEEGITTIASAPTLRIVSLPKHKKEAEGNGSGNRNRAQSRNTTSQRPRRSSNTTAAAPDFSAFASADGRQSNNHNGNGRGERGDRRRNRNNRSEREQMGNPFAERRRNRKKDRHNKKVQPAPKVEIARPTHIKLPETIAVKDLASKMSYTAAEVIKKLFMMGVMATINQEIDYDTAALVASEFGVTCEELPPEVDPTEIPEIEDDPKSLKLRPPVVTVMGHVDHGKTSLLDTIRHTSVSAHEAGGITQAIGAYQVMCNGKKIVFLDTPGHEAFTAMRARGAQITDIAILVVAADDGVMPQTIEAIHHAKSAKVPIIVAINKIDKPGANPERVKQELMEQGLVPEEYGGDVIMVPVSAKKNIGINDLLENVLLVAEVEELKANPNRDARGVIIEAQLDKGRGPVATVLVQNGTLRIGDSVVVGTTYGKVRAMVNDRGDEVKKAGPSVPVEILGLNDVPAAGDVLAVLEDKQARSIAEARAERAKTKMIKSKKVSLDDLFQQIKAGEIKDLNIVVKADVQGSVEALSSSLLKLNKNDEVRVSIVHSGVGAVNESDVMLASASNALIIAFNVHPDANARRVAESENIDIRTYNVIYDAINDVKDAMSGMLKPKYKEVVQGRVEIRKVMKFSKALVAGSYVLEGKICNNSKIRILRDNVEVFDGEIDSLRRFKDEVKEVNAGYECGISIVDYRDFREGDIIEAYTLEEVAVSITDANKEAAAKHEAEEKAKAEAAKKKADEEE